MKMNNHRNLNKKGTDKVLSVYWFTILFIVAAAIVYIVAVFYGNPYDVRDIESNILINKVADCLSEREYLNEKFFDEKGNFLSDGETFLKECNLNFNVENFKNWNEQSQHYIEINFYEFNSDLGIGQKEFDSFVVGNVNLKGDCEMKGRNFPKCAERSFYALKKTKDEDVNPDKQIIVKILTAVRKTEKNAK